MIGNVVVVPVDEVDDDDGAAMRRCCIFGVKASQKILIRSNVMPHVEFFVSCAEEEDEEEVPTL